MKLIYKAAQELVTKFRALELLESVPNLRSQTTNPRAFQKNQGEVHIDLDKILHQLRGWHLHNLRFHTF